jgi:hypothetical protein
VNIIPEPQSDFDGHIASLLEEAGIPFQRDATLSGVRPDFVIESPRGGVIVVEAKTYPPGTEGQVRAYEQVRYYKDKLGADRAFVVLQGLEQGRLSEGVVSATQLLRFLEKEFRQSRVTKGRAAGRTSRGQRDVFAAMPFSPEYNDVFFVAMAQACDRVNLACRRVDKDDYEGDVVARIKQMIQQSVAVIADLSESKPNVLYEVGYAHALGRPTVHISSTPVDELPFDVRNWNTILYSKGQTFELITPLATRLGKAIEGP